MSDAIRLGWDHASYALAYATGAALPLLTTALIVLSVLPLYRGVRHRVTVARLHRVARRSGRRS